MDEFADGSAGGLQQIYHIILGCVAISVCLSRWEIATTAKYHSIPFRLLYSKVYVPALVNNTRQLNRAKLESLPAMRWRQMFVENYS